MVFSSRPGKTGKSLWFIGAALSAISAPAFAQEASDEIVVVGSIRAAQETSVEAKREADNLVEVAAADAVGRFPDQNTAAALARLPAIAVQRDQGQERYIQVRGAPNRWTSVSFDGIPVIGVDEGGATRAFRFDAVPAVLLSAIVVNKSLTPNISAEAIVANIDLQTYSPLSGERGFDLQGDLGYGAMQLGGGEQRQGSVRLSWSNDTIGFVLGGSHYLRDQLTDNRESAYDALGPTILDIRQYEVTRENNGLFAGVEFEPNASTRMFAHAVYTEFNDDENRHQYVFRLSNARSGTRTATGGDLVGVPVRGSFNAGEYRTRYNLYTVGADFEFGEWAIEARANVTESENTTYLPLVQQSTSTAQAVSLNYDFRDPDLPRVQLFQTVAGATPGSVVRGPALTTLDQSAFASSIFIPVLQDSFSESTTFKVDATRDFGDVSLTTGVSYVERQLDGFTFATANVVALTTAFPTVGRTFTPGAYVSTTPWDTGFPLGVPLTYIDNARMRTDVEAGIAALQAAGTFNPANSVPAINRYDLTEELISGYLMLEVPFDGGQIVFGGRVENFSQGNTGTVQLAGGVRQTLSVPQDYTDFFPSINVRWDLSENLVGRLSVQRSLARPSFGEIRVGASINDTTLPGTVAGGNPALTPEYTNGLDASLEYYLPGDGILAVSGYYRAVENVLYSNTQAVGSDAFDSNGVDRSNYLLTSSFNGRDGSLYGIEFNYQQQFVFLPPPFDGFGFQGNLTFLDGSFDTEQRRDIAFPGASPTIVNASIYYEKFGLSARVSYQWRDDWLDTLGGLGVGSTGDEYRAAYENLDIALRYTLTDNVTVYADFSNLTDATYVAYQGRRNQPTEVEQIGSRYLVGLRFGF